MSMEEQMFEDEGYSYKILSKPIGQPKAPAKQSNGVHENGTAAVTS